MEERDERLVDEEENLHEICNQLNEIKRSVDDILQYAYNGLDIGEQMQIEDGAELLRKKIDEAYKNVNEAANLLDSLRWLLL